jgi:hypothetical protein
MDKGAHGQGQKMTYGRAHGSIASDTDRALSSFADGSRYGRASLPTIFNAKVTRLICASSVAPSTRGAGPTGAFPVLPGFV